MTLAEIVEVDEAAEPMMGAVSTQVMDERALAQTLVEQAKDHPVGLLGPGGLLSSLTKHVLELALEVEMEEHLGYAHGAEPVGSNMRNGHRTKTVMTEIGPVEIEVPRDREGSFEPHIVKKRQRRLHGIDELVLSLSARGLTTGEIEAHFAEVYDAKVSKDTISRITEKVVGEMTEWASRPLDRVYPVIFVDAIHVKVRDGQVRNTAFYVVIGVTKDGERDILGIWAGDGGEGAQFWLRVFTELKNRGVEDVLIACCDGLKGLPDAITTTWPRTIVQQCVIHLLRNSFKYAGRQHRDAIAKDLRPVYQAPSKDAARARFEEFTAKWGEKYPAIVGLWESAWAELVPFLDFDVEIRKVICTTNAIESINARYRRAVRARGHFPNDQAALKCLYLVTRSLDPSGKGRARWVVRWKAPLNAFAIAFPGRLDPAEK